MYLVFGNDRLNYQQAIFSILTILPQLIAKEEIVVVTDTPARFALLGDNIRITEVSKEIFEEWKGPHGNFFRIKIMAMLHVAEHTNNCPVLYLDADTFLFGSLKHIRTSIDGGFNVMHKNEGKLSISTSKSQKPLWVSLKGKTIEGIGINENLCMWNAGVIGISKVPMTTLKIALNLCDTISKMHIKPRLIEQLSISIALSHISDIKSAETDIGHYWGNKSMWNEKIEDVFLDSYFNKMKVEELIDVIKGIDFKDIPINIKSKDTKIRLQGLISKFFKDKKVEFINKL